MISRCPECATAFRVSQAQLDARNGQVRCGHCGEVFDALATLESADEQAGPEAQLEPLLEPAPEPGAQQPPATALSESHDDELQPQFGPRPRRKPSLWWAATAVLLMVALTLQALFYFRGAVALVWPESKPYIQRFCARLGCEVPLPRRAELMSIETSDLQADPATPGVMVLSATLRNRAAFPQAFPALELTLTNERDQPLARRVLQPVEYLKGTSADAAMPTCVGGVATCEVQVRLFLEAAALKASGYRLYLFYP
jgi:predicted Zn finger-like uncharacterized protein